ncbi:MAG: GNVR domain-containing protein, partial [Candidatus Eisenbacteria bacterium]
LESGGARNETRFEIPFRDYPDLSLAYLRVFREVKVQETIYEFLVQQYEQFRIQESRDTPTVHVLDRAVPAERKTKPTRSLICISATLLAFLLSSVLAIGIEALRRMRSESPERFERLHGLLREIGLARLIARL